MKSSCHAPTSDIINLIIEIKCILIHIKKNITKGETTHKFGLKPWAGLSKKSDGAN